MMFYGCYMYAIVIVGIINFREVEFVYISLLMFHLLNRFVRDGQIPGTVAIMPQFRNKIKMRTIQIRNFV